MRAAAHHRAQHLLRMSARHSTARRGRDWKDLLFPTNRLVGVKNSSRQQEARGRCNAMAQENWNG